MSSSAYCDWLISISSLCSEFSRPIDEGSAPNSLTSNFFCKRDFKSFISCSEFDKNSKTFIKITWMSNVFSVDLRKTCSSIFDCLHPRPSIISKNREHYISPAYLRRYIDFVNQYAWSGYSCLSEKSVAGSIMTRSRGYGGDTRCLDSLLGRLSDSQINNWNLIHGLDRLT